MKKFDLYLLRQFFGIFLMALLGFVSIFIIVDLIENLDRFIDNHVPWPIVGSYYFYSFPWFVSIALPMSVLIATVFSVGGFVKRNEWTAMKSSGISLYRLALPLFIVGSIISIGSFILDNEWVSWGNEKRFEIDRDHVKRRSRHKLKNVLNNIFLQKNSDAHISLAKFRIDKKRGNDLAIVQLHEKAIKQRIDAKHIIWNQDVSLWQIKDYSIRSFSLDGKETAVVISKKDTIISLGFSPQDIQKQARSPEELDYFELTSRIAQLKSNGVDTLRWEVIRYMKISFSFTSLILILFGIPLVVFKEDNSLSFGAGMSVFVIFSYYAFIKFGQSLGFNGILEPILSAWLGNILFFAGGSFLLLRAKK
ncbi:MAG: YjgP/YjgQ family permease [Candidatus Marinimicrobia bacterium]|nr:YjgP/YjgQ family permease [Candidatus Neomarinimicrobiota bacterium]MBT4144041.1 YjgP/YjgQ family permease [Candidatus Neomarinimicrobiota bacterium]MBT4177247.1 YjgP/YjgQ family permease [Candidatus Neomarinimicrobiota bacterium]MBT4594113.1 YjgP/YjgQ family permease [Candidatus Neomarinimicrobiota bacterium]MBT5355252.1 YjgP/YjgQ family permease [Candidatus Neomarinimicrobiota bacterium]